MRSKRVLTLLRAAHLLLHGSDVFILQQFPGNLAANAQHFRQRSAGYGLDAEDKMAFAEFGQKFAAELWQDQQGGDTNQKHHQYDCSRPAGERTECSSIARFQPPLQTRFRGASDSLGEKEQ